MHRFIIYLVLIQLFLSFFTSIAIRIPIQGQLHALTSHIILSIKIIINKRQSKGLNPVLRSKYSLVYGFLFVMSTPTSEKIFHSIPFTVTVLLMRQMVKYSRPIFIILMSTG